MTVLSTARFDNAREGECAVLEVWDARGKRGKKTAPRPVPLKETFVGGSVQGPLASISVVQIFDCSFLAKGVVAEAVYRFPLPGDAIVRSVTVTFGRVRIATRLAERGEAQSEYDDALETGRQAVLVTREGDDAFTLRIAGITREAPVRVKTTFLLWLKPIQDGWSLRLPLTLAPRYVRSDEEHSVRAGAQPLESRWDPAHRVRLLLVCRGVAEASCPTNVIRSENKDGELRVTFDEDVVWPDQDLLLEFRTTDRGSDARLDVFAAPDDDGGVFLALASARDDHSGIGVPRDLLILVDHSGSMSGPKWEAADWAVKSLLSRLGDDDAFNLGFFHDTCRWMTAAPVKATETNRLRAERFISACTDSGGTELGVALEQALSQSRGEGRAARHVIVVTDAQVSDHDRISALVGREAGREDFRRVSVVCIDAAPNEPLVSAMTEAGRGVACFLTSNPDEVDITTALDELFLEFSRPLALGLRLESDATLAEAAGRYAAGDGALDLGDLVAGRPRWICGRFRRMEGAGGAVEFRLKEGSGALLASASADADAGEGEWGDAIRGLCGALRVRRLESIVAAPNLGNIPEILERMGLASQVRETLYPENERLAAGDIEALLVRESLAAGVPCSKTAFVAVREESGTKVSERLVVPNALPRGWGAGFAIPSPCMASSAPCPPDFEEDSFMEAAVEREEAAPAGERVLFEGPVETGKGCATLFDGVAGEGRLAGIGAFRTLAVEATIVGEGDADIRILVNGSLAAKVRLSDLLRLGGRRPLNVRLRTGDRVRIELACAGVPVSGKMRLSAG